LSSKQKRSNSPKGVKIKKRMPEGFAFFVLYFINEALQSSDFFARNSLKSPSSKDKCISIGLQHTSQSST